ncbi:MAG TPA: O-antigen ligase family protein [Candidatus Binatia bacterium]|nr:O-antigen ligase family protein [Candidatus Binatia bacterium]
MYLPAVPLLEAIVLGLLTLIPAIFYLGTTEQFEFPKTEFLATGVLVLAAILLARTMARFPRVRIGSALRRDPLGAAILLFLISSVASTLVSIRPDMSVFGAAQYYAAGLKTAFGTSALYFASRSLASDERWLARVSWAATAALAIATIYSLLQFAHLDPIAWNPSATFGGMARWPGTLAHANHLGTYIAMTIPLVLWLARRATSLGTRAICAALAMLSLAILAATLSRGAWAACAAGILVFGLLMWRAARLQEAQRGSLRAVLVAILLASGAACAPLLTPLRPALLSRLHQITDIHEPSMHMRVLNWRAGIRMARDHPVLGVGTDAYIAAFPRYRTPEFWGLEWNVAPSKAHNEVIGVVATQGALGLIAALLVVILAGRAVWRAAKHPSHEVRQGAAAAGGALAAFAVSDLASFTVVSTGCLAAALAGWAAGVTRSPTAAPGDEVEAGTDARPSPFAWAAGIAVAIVVWVPLVLLPWLADTAAAKANWVEISSPQRASAFARASAIAPWDARYASELGRSLLAGAFTVTADSSARWELLARARSAFERATRIGPTDGENRALLARVLASQAALRPSAVPLREVRSQFDRAIELEPENANVLELAAQGYLELHRTAESRAAALRCAALFPDFALPMADVGVVALLESRPADAADTLSLALRRNWHGQGGAEAAAKRNYSLAVQEMGEKASAATRGTCERSSRP